MMKQLMTRQRWCFSLMTMVALAGQTGLASAINPSASQIVVGREVAVERHLQNGAEFDMSIGDLRRYGEKLFTANWTAQEGGGRPLTKGNGAPLTNPGEPLVFPRNFNRISAPDANSCAGCHHLPRAGGAGDIVSNVFVLGQRFDFATFDTQDPGHTTGAIDERGRAVDLGEIANSRATLGMFGSGYIEMLARQITAELQAVRDAMSKGESRTLTAKGVSFGILKRRADGSWDVSDVEGLAAPSLATASADAPPSLVVRPFHQAGNVISLRQFSNSAFNHHHGMQSEERFGTNVDADGDSFKNELTQADITAVTLFQATLPVPGRMIPNHPIIEQAVLIGELNFQEIGCTQCHMPSLPLDNQGWVFSEPNPYNPPGNLRPGAAPPLQVDLADAALPKPRLPVRAAGVVQVPAFTDLKLHDICAGPDDPNIEPLNMNQPLGSEAFFSGNRKMLTRKLWDVGKKPNYFHHGRYTTMRQAILAHGGEALNARRAFEALRDVERDSVIEFLKTLRTLPPGAPSVFVDEHGEPKRWPPMRLTKLSHSGHARQLTWSGSHGLYQLEQADTPSAGEDATSTLAALASSIRVLMLSTPP